MKGILATSINLGSGAVAFLVTLDAALKIGVEITGIAAGCYAFLYWRKKLSKLETE